MKWRTHQMTQSGNTHKNQLKTKYGETPNKVGKDLSGGFHNILALTVMDICAVLHERVETGHGRTARSKPQRSLSGAVLFVHICTVSDEQLHNCGCTCAAQEAVCETHNHTHRQSARTVGTRSHQSRAITVTQRIHIADLLRDDHTLDRAVIAVARRTHECIDCTVCS